MEKEMLKTLMTGALALSMWGGATAASAQPWHPVERNRIERVDHRDFDRFEGRRFDRDDFRFGNHRWVRGERFVPVYGRSFVVGDWYRYHLRRPPYGYHWVRYGDDFLLVAIGTGIIADMLLDQPYAPYY
jgi:Ni/Co efflux regulator RcnB